MKKIFIIISYLFLFTSINAQVLFGVSKSTGGSSNIDFAGKTVVWMGDSFTRGFGVTSAQRFSKLFCDAKGAIEDNRGVDGGCIQTGLVCSGYVPFDKTTIPTYIPGTHAALFLIYGAGDVLRDDGNFTLTGFNTDYNTDVDYATSVRGWPSNIIIICTPFRIFNYSITICGVACNASVTRQTNYNSTTLSLSISKSTRYFDSYGAMASYTSGQYQADQIHPNVSGHSLFATSLLSAF